MKKFSFSLQSVLDVKTAREDIVRQELAELKKQLSREQERLEDFYTSWEDACLITSAPDLGEILSWQYYRENLRHKIAAQTQAVSVKASEVDNGLDKMKKASREKEILEKLKEQQLDLFMKQDSARQQKFLDEIAVSSFTRKMNIK